MDFESYRVTATIGRETVDRGELLDEAKQINTRLRGHADVSFDPVKGTISVALRIQQPDALQAGMSLLAQLVAIFADQKLAPPRIMVSLESEHVPRPENSSLPEHADEV